MGSPACRAAHVRLDQVYRYATNLPCDEIIVISVREEWLYYKGAH
jgi:hypothetical protein